MKTEEYRCPFCKKKELELLDPTDSVPYFALVCSSLKCDSNWIMTRDKIEELEDALEFSNRDFQTTVLQHHTETEQRKREMSKEKPKLGAKGSYVPPANTQKPPPATKKPSAPENRRGFSSAASCSTILMSVKISESIPKEKLFQFDEILKACGGRYLMNPFEGSVRIHVHYSYESAVDYNEHKKRWRTVMTETREVRKDQWWRRKLRRVGFSFLANVSAHRRT